MIDVGYTNEQIPPGMWTGLARELKYRIKMAAGMLTPDEQQVMMRASEIADAAAVKAERWEKAYFEANPS